MIYHRAVVALFVLAMLQVLGGMAISATITGTVKYEGEVPSFQEIKMDADPICLAKHAGPIFPETLVLGDSQTLANVLVWVKSGLAKKDYPVTQEPVVLDQEGCRYKPHVFGIRVGQQLRVDRLAHELRHGLPSALTDATEKAGLAVGDVDVRAPHRLYTIHRWAAACTDWPTAASPGPT